MHSTFNLLVCPNCLLTPFFFSERAMCYMERWLLLITIIIIILVFGVVIDYIKT